MREVKDLALAYKIANEFDYMPGSDRILDIRSIFDLEESIVTRICDNYEGWSCSNLINEIISKIENI